jgi:hypothetical protein
LIAASLLALISGHFLYFGKTTINFVSMENLTINCATDCQNGCLQPDNCPGTEHINAAANFIGETSLDQMHEMAEAARRKKMLAPPQWVIPEWPE